MWMALSCFSACLKLLGVYYYFTVNKGHTTRALPNIFWWGGIGFNYKHMNWRKKWKKKILLRDRFISPKEHMLLKHLMKIHTLKLKSKTEPVFKHCSVQAYDPWKTSLKPPATQRLEENYFLCIQCSSSELQPFGSEFTKSQKDGN